jgi:hypothetical protein
MGLMAMPLAAAAPPAWRGHAGDSQHTAAAPATSQSLGHILWQTPVDLDPQQQGDGELAIHYASPMITAANTVLVPVKTTASGNWEIQARQGGTGQLVWTLASDYIEPLTASTVPPFPAQLTRQGNLYIAGAGGTVFSRKAPDNAKGKSARLAFYGLPIFNAHTAALTQSVMIATPITADSAGNIYFGFLAEGKNAAGVVSGLARISAKGVGSWVSAATASGDSTMNEVPIGCAPAISADGKTVYVAVSNGSAGYLVALDSATLAPVAHVALIDPSSGKSAWVTDLSTASPTIGPDGDVYYGVVENPFPNHDGRGWLLHFDAALATVKTPGSFGWDDTASIVPGADKHHYNVMVKYNNYVGVGPLGDGRNKIAILDPAATQADEYSTVPVTVMKEVQTVLGPTPQPGEPKGAVYEWCVNTSVVDAASGAVFAGNEDGNFYRWDLASNTLSQKLTLSPPQGESYTPTLIGPDGTVYAINTAVLFAIGN